MVNLREFANSEGDIVSYSQVEVPSPGKLARDLGFESVDAMEAAQRVVQARLDKQFELSQERFRNVKVPFTD